jgi:FkbM family methyltransferase
MKFMAKLLDALSSCHTVAEGEAAGLKLATRSGDRNFARGTYEQPVQDAIASNLLPGDVFYDIGANIGFLSLVAARRVTVDGRVYAFEPLPRNAAAIAYNAKLNGFHMIEVFPEAVGASTGRNELLLAHHIGGAALASAGPPPDMRGQIEVDVVRLDDAIARRDLLPPSLVKIDVEGAEIDVLRGMTGTLRTHWPTVIYEIDDATREGLDRKASDIAAFMTAAGYDLTPLPASYPNEAWHVEHVLARPGAT